MCDIFRRHDRCSLCFVRSRVSAPFWSCSTCPSILCRACDGKFSCHGCNYCRDHAVCAAQIRHEVIYSYHNEDIPRTLGLLLNHFELFLHASMHAALANIVSKNFQSNKKAVSSEQFLFGPNSLNDAMIASICGILGPDIYDQLYSEMQQNFAELAKSMRPSAAFIRKNCTCDELRYLHTFCPFCGCIFNIKNDVCFELNIPKISIHSRVMENRSSSNSSFSKTFRRIAPSSVIDDPACELQFPFGRQDLHNQQIVRKARSHNKRKHIDMNSARIIATVSDFDVDLEVIHMSQSLCSKIETRDFEVDKAMCDLPAPFRRSDVRMNHSLLFTRQHLSAKENRNISTENEFDLQEARTVSSSNFDSRRFRAIESGTSVHIILAVMFCSQTKY